MAIKLNNPHKTIITCTQCRVVLYEAQPRALSADNHANFWKPVMHGSRRPPNQPPKKCPFCSGSTIQKAAVHG